MTDPGWFTVRLRLDQLAPQTGGGSRTQVNIATANARNAANRPVLSVSSSPSPAQAPEATVPNGPAGHDAHRRARDDAPDPARVRTPASRPRG